VLKERSSIAQAMFEFRRIHEISSVQAARALDMTEENYVELEEQNIPTIEQYIKLTLSRKALPADYKACLDIKAQQDLIGHCDEVIGAAEVLRDVSDEDGNYQGVFNIMLRGMKQVRTTLLGG